MTTDLTVLLLAVLLAFVQLMLYAVPGNRELGIRYTLGPRDTPPDMSTVTARLKRAYENHLETLPWFAIVVLVAHVTGRASEATAIASVLYICARTAYVPVYALGIPVLRSALWAIATFSILGILLLTFL